MASMRVRDIESKSEIYENIPIDDLSGVILPIFASCNRYSVVDVFAGDGHIYDTGDKFSLLTMNDILPISGRARIYSNRLNNILEKYKSPISRVRLRY